MVRYQRGEIWWADLGEPRGSEPGYRRPVLIVQGDAFNQSGIATVIVLSLTSNARHARFPGNIAVPRVVSKLKNDSVINATQFSTIDVSALETRIAKLPATVMAEVDAGLSLVLGLGG